MANSRFIFGLFVSIIGIHFFGVFRDWYYLVPWLDIPMHFFGGFFVALLFIWLRQIAPNIFGGNSFLGDIIVVLGFVALIGVLWEFFEFSFDYLVSARNLGLARSQMGIADTMGDLFFDLLGGLCAYIGSLFSRQ